MVASCWEILSFCGVTMDDICVRRLGQLAGRSNQLQFALQHTQHIYLGATMFLFAQKLTA